MKKIFKTLAVAALVLVLIAPLRWWLPISLSAAATRTASADMLATLRANAWKYTALALGLGLGFALTVQSIRLAEARLETAHVERTLHAERASAARAALTTSERYRTLEGNHRDQIAKIDTDAQAAIAAAGAGRARADLARNRLQRELADYITQHRSAATARAAAGQCAPDTGPADLLAELQRRADDRAGELAHIADTARARGLACERAYDSARTMIEAAGQPEK